MKMQKEFSQVQIKNSQIPGAKLVVEIESETWIRSFYHETLTHATHVVNAALDFYLLPHQETANLLSNILHFLG
jgi:hypothetical protein